VKWARRYRRRLRAAYRAALGAWRNEYVTIQVDRGGETQTWINCLRV